MTTAALIIASVLLLWLLQPYRRLRIPGGFFMLLPKLAAGALGPVVSLACLVVAVFAALSNAWLVAGAYLTVAIVGLFPAASILAVRDDLDGMLSYHNLSQLDKRGMLHRRWGILIPAKPNPRIERDMAFWHSPETGRPLLCDVWQPPVSVQPSGLAYIYFHGSAWVMLDKDFATAGLFRYLASQGHVIMDVAYRLYPETDVEGMVGDVRRAIIWLKENSGRFGVDPRRIVIGGSSAGGHISLLAAYTPDDPALWPEDVVGGDTTVRGVVSIYGPVDMRDAFDHMNMAEIAARNPQAPDWDAPVPPMANKLFGPGAARLGFQKAVGAGRLDLILDGTPASRSDRYSLLSPTSHVRPGCPPTLLIQATNDLISPAPAVVRLAHELREASVPVTNVMLPFSDHMFDLFLFRISPSARIAVWYMERFLAMIAATDR